uniref:Putative conserved secreted protein n=1 Tax=Amblyomma aureolatum TaxID=187763 RepID=A0A1E1XIL9_9ACAR
MRHFIVFVAGALLIGKTSGDETPTQKPPPADICNEFGNEFCKHAKCSASLDVKGTFTCKCERDNMYFDAAKGMCQYKRSCATMECSVGECKEGNTHSQAKCVCENKDHVTLYCKVEDFFAKDCQRKGGTAMVNMKSMGGARCNCGKWAVMNSNKTKCVPTTCLYPALSCKDLCEKNLLDKDTRCCEGWDQKDCSKAPQDGTYCSPGTIRKEGSCLSACTAGEAKLICKNGCRKARDSVRAYECVCNSGYVVAEDGIQCKVDNRRDACSQEDEQTCLPGQYCIMKNNAAVCECPINQRLVKGKCTGGCSENKCHEDFGDCDIYFGRQSCFCPWTHRKHPKSPVTKVCRLNEYYYTVTFRPNISLDARDCAVHETRVLQAMQTAIGPEIFKVEILSCTDHVKARLIAGKPLSHYLLRKLQTCEYPEGNTCIIYPKLPILKGSATEIEEENLCDSLLKAQSGATKDTNECVIDGDYFWFKCKPGFFQVDLKTSGRLRRSVCEPQAMCAEDKNQECNNKGEDCVVENGEAVCKQKGDSSATTEASPAPATCTEEKNQECNNKGEECVVENDEAVCKKKGDSTATTQAPHGSGSRTVPVSVVLILAIMIPALYT